MTSKVYIIGHKNPDTDSAVSATAYARLKRLLGKSGYVACRAGHLAPQAEYVYKRFNVDPPEYVPDLIPKTGYYMRRDCVTVDRSASLWEAVNKMISSGVPALPIVSGDGTYEGLLNYNAFAVNSFRILSPKSDDIFLTSVRLMEKTLGAVPIVEFDEDEYFQCSIMVGDDDGLSFRGLLKEKECRATVVVAGDREDIQRAAIESGVRAVIVTNNYTVKKELRDLAEKNKVSLLSGHDSTVTTVMLVEYSSPVISMQNVKIPPVRQEDPVQSIREPLSQSPSRCLPVVDDNYKLMGIISESSLLQEANIQVILVDHNEEQQAVEGVENYTIQEIIDHHRINTFTTRAPITFINMAVGSTSSIIANMYQAASVPVPKDMASILLCGILSDTLILKSATTTEYDVRTAEYLSNITSLDINELGNDIIKSGSRIQGRSAEDIIHQDMKEYTEGKYKYSVSQIEVDSTQEILGRAQELLDALERGRKAGGNLFFALLVTDITRLSSLMFLAGDAKFETLAGFPRVEEHIYYLKDIVSRKKQLIPLLSELIAKAG